MRGLPVKGIKFINIMKPLNEIKKDKNKIKEEIERILEETKVTFKLARVTGSESVYTMETGKEFDSFVKELTDYITKSNREVVEGFAKHMTKMTKPPEAKDDWTGWWEEQALEYLSQLNKGNDYDNK